MNAYLNFWVGRARMGMKKFLYKENGDVNIVTIVILIGIAVILALAFKDAIVKLLQDLFSNINSRTGEIDGNVSFNN